MRPAELGAIVGQQLGNGEQAILDRRLERLELRDKLIMESNIPRHLYSFQAMSGQENVVSQGQAAFLGEAAALADSPLSSSDAISSHVRAVANFSASSMWM